MLLLNRNKKGKEDILVIMRKKKRPTPKRLEITYKKDSNFLYQVKEKIGLKGCHK